MELNKELTDRILREFERRNFEPFYEETVDEAIKRMLCLIPPKASVTWGGSVTLAENGFLTAVKRGNYEILDRAECKNAEELKETYRKAFCCNFFLMSANAVALDGQLVNMDGVGNRVAALAYGPDNVIVVIGKNKLCRTLDEARERIHYAAGKNAIRLNKITPCSITGKCADCRNESRCCSQEIITSYSKIKGRIKIILVNQNLGY